MTQQLEMQPITNGMVFLDVLEKDSGNSFESELA